jgi:hypothetical protein
MQVRTTFGLTLYNIPLVNLRMEFKRTHAFMREPILDKALNPPFSEPIRAPLMIWGGMPDDLLTLLLQRALLGIESYIAGGVYECTGRLGKLDKELVEKIRNPFRFGSRSLVENVYHLMPSAVDDSCSLRTCDEDLWKEAQAFYKEVRNPLFHGKQLHDCEPAAVRRAFDFVARLYEWIDSWYSLELLIRGGSALSVKAQGSP